MRCHDKILMRTQYFFMRKRIGRFHGNSTSTSGKSSAIDRNPLLRDGHMVSRNSLNDLDQRKSPARTRSLAEIAFFLPLKDIGKRVRTENNDLSPLKRFSTHLEIKARTETASVIEHQEVSIKATDAKRHTKDRENLQKTFSAALRRSSDLDKVRGWHPLLIGAADIPE